MPMQADRVGDGGILTPAKGFSIAEPSRTFLHHPRQEALAMHDMLTAFHLVRYFELRIKEQEPYRELIPEKPSFVGMRLFRKLYPKLPD
jgi:hypothetical protein